MPRKFDLSTQQSASVDEADVCAEVRAVPTSGASVNCTAGEERREGPRNRWVGQPEDQRAEPRTAGVWQGDL